MVDVLRCWRDLDTCRPMQWVALPDRAFVHFGAIPWDAIDAWARRAHLDDDAFRLLADVITHLDAAFMERQASEQRMKR